VLVDAESTHTVEEGLIGSRRPQQGLDAAPHDSPTRAQLTGEPGDRGMFAVQLSTAHQHTRVLSSARGRASCSHAR
jgi:hypothetical protein